MGEEGVSGIQNCNFRTAQGTAGTRRLISSLVSLISMQQVEAD